MEIKQGDGARSWEGDVASPTGGADGIVQAVARRLAGRGAHVVLVDGDAGRTHAIADELAEGSEAVVIEGTLLQVDGGSIAAGSSMVEQYTRWNVPA